MATLERVDTPVEPSLESHIGFVTKNLRILIVGLILGMVMGAAWYALTPVTYSSTVRVALNRLPTHIAFDPDSETAKSVTIDTDATLLTSDFVSSAVARDLQVPIEEVERHLTVTATPLSDALNITLNAADAERAEQAATTAARSLLRQREKYFVSRQRKQIAYLQQRVARLREVFATASSEPLRVNEVTSIQSALEVLAPRLSAAKRMGAEAGVVLNTQSEPVARRPSTLTVPLISGAMCGLLLAMAWVRLRSASE